MPSIKSTGRIAGALFLVVMVLWFIGYSILDSLLNTSDYLSVFYPNKTKVTVGVLVELLEVACVLGITFILFPILKMRHESLAVSYVGFRIFECMMLIVALMCPLLLVSLSQEYISTGISDTSYFETMALLLKETRQDWSFFVLGLFHPLAALPLYYFLYQSKLIPRFLSIWGFLAALWVLVDEVILESFGLGFGRIGGNPIAGIPMGANEVVLGIWLIIKGFDPSADFFQSNKGKKQTLLSNITSN